MSGRSLAGAVVRSVLGIRDSAGDSDHGLPTSDDEHISAEQAEALVYPRRVRLRRKGRMIYHKVAGLPKMAKAGALIVYIGAVGFLLVEVMRRWI